MSTKILILFTIFLLNFSQLYSQEKKVIYWQGNSIFNDGNKAKDIITRGFNYVVITKSIWYTPDFINYDHVFKFFQDYKLDVIVELDDDLNFYMEDPFLNPTNYFKKVNSFYNFLENYGSKISGIVLDIEISTYRKQKFEADGGYLAGIRLNKKSVSRNTSGNTVTLYDYFDAEARIAGNSKPGDWLNFEEYLESKNIEVPDSLTMNNIQFNYPKINIKQENSNHLNGFLLGYYAPYFEGAYHRIAQTFKLKSDDITRIDIKIKRMIDGINEYSASQKEIISRNNQNSMWYYLTKVNIDGTPDLKQRLTGVRRLEKNEINYLGLGQDNFDNIDFTSLYFDPSTEGKLLAGTEIALILEYGISDVRKYSNGDLKWKGGHYRVATVDNSEVEKTLKGKFFKGWQTEFGRGWSKPYNQELLYKIYSPSTDSIKAKMHDFWVDFQCYIISEMVSDVEIEKNKFNSKHNENIDLYIYSDYQKANDIYYNEKYTPETYSVDWRKLTQFIDYAICGYIVFDPNDPESVDKFRNNHKNPTIDYLGNKNKLIGGVKDHDGDNEYFNALFQECSGGVMYYFNPGVKDANYKIVP